MAETLLNCFAASEGLFLDVVEKIKDMETHMFFKKAKSVKKAVFGRSTWLVRRGQQERKEGKKSR